MKQRKQCTQATSAAKSGFSERSGRRIDAGTRIPGPKTLRTYRTRKDPLVPVWESIVVPLLEENPSLKPVGVFDHLCDIYPEGFSSRHRRTLERRVRQWQALYGEEREVIFRQVKELGKQGIMDFTWADFTVTIQGVPLNHRFFHYRLPASGWGFAQVVYGGESFSAVATGLQTAFQLSGGVPEEVRTDSLSAAYKNGDSERQFTERFAELAAHYGFRPTRNNLGIAHENGAIESPNNHLKNQVRQALTIRGSHDFDSREDYESFIHALVERRNRRITDSLSDEQEKLQPLPAYDSVNFTVHPVRVTTTGTFQLRRATYSVPSRLVGETLRVHLYDKILEIYCHGQPTLTLERVHTQGNIRGHRIDYRHLIGNLMKKPRAFRGCQWRDHLLPSADYRQIWAQVDVKLSADEASLYMVKLLNLAHKSDRESAVGRFVLDKLSEGSLPSIVECEERFLKDEQWSVNPLVEQHTLSSYMQILEGGA